MEIRDLPELPDRLSATEETFAIAVAALFRTLPGWTGDLRAIGNLSALSTNATSATPITNDTDGAKTINIGAGKGFMRTQRVLVAYTTAIFMEARVVSYDFATGDLIFLPSRAVGAAGPYADWAVSLLAEPANVGKQAYWCSSPAWKSRATAGPAITEFETPVNKLNYRAQAFDKATKEYSQLNIVTGNSWDALTISGRPIWSHATNAVTFNKVAWGLRAMAIGNGDSLDTALGDTQYSNDVGGAAGTLYIGDDTPAITVANGPAKGDQLWLECFRNADDAVNDTLDEDARLHGWVVYLTHSQGNDA